MKRVTSLLSHRRAIMRSGKTSVIWRSHALYKLPAFVIFSPLQYILIHNGHQVNFFFLCKIPIMESEMARPHGHGHEQEPQVVENQMGKF